MNKKKIFVSGTFNVLHSGHIRLLRFAKELGGHLIVGVQGDKISSGESFVPENLRLEAIKTNSFVDETFIFNKSIEDVLHEIKPDIVVKGKEHEYKDNDEAKVLKKYGGKLLFGSGESIFSSVDLVHKEFEIFSGKFTKATDFLVRHKINTDKLKKKIRDFNKLTVTVVGDLIVDEYITCDPIGMSHEDPTMVVTPIDKIKFVGGAGIVAKHAANFGAKVNFFTIVGDDEEKTFVEKDLKKYSNLNANLVTDESRPTTLKQKFRSKGKSLLRVSHLHKDAISDELQNKIFNLLKSKIKQSNLLVFSDFNYGCLPQTLVDRIIKIAKENKVYIVADSQSSSQIGNICRFKNINLLTPTEREARISMRDQDCGLVVLAQSVSQKAFVAKVLLKLGAEGLLIHSSNKSLSKFETDRIGALNQVPKDMAGAGDSMLIVSAMVMVLEGTIWEAAYLGSLASAIEVGKVGNHPLEIEELLKLI